MSQRPSNPGRLLPAGPSSAPLTRKDKHLQPWKPANSIIKHQQMLSLEREFHDHESHCPGDSSFAGEPRGAEFLFGSIMSPQSSTGSAFLPGMRPCDQARSQ